MTFLRSDFRRRALVFLGFAVIGTLASFAAAAGLLLSSALSGSGPFKEEAWAALAFSIMGVCGLPAIYLSARGLLGEVRFQPRSRNPRWFAVLILFPLGLFLVYISSSLGASESLLNPLGYMLSATTPILAGVLIVSHTGPLTSPTRNWGHFLLGLWAATPVALVVELVLLVPVGLLTFAALVFTSDEQLLVELFSNLNTWPPTLGQEMFYQLAANPVIIVLAGGFITILVPLIEEAVKTIAIWPWLRRSLSPSEAFLGGALGGAGFALFESLLMAQPGNDWLAVLIGRGGASFMHVFTSGLTCWGLAEGVTRKRWGAALLSFLTAAFLHGTWNAAALGISLAASPAGSHPPLATANAMRPIELASLIVVLLLAVVSVVGSSLAGSLLAKKPHPPSQAQSD